MELNLHSNLAEYYLPGILLLPALRDLTLNVTSEFSGEIYDGIHIMNPSEQGLVNHDDYSTVISRLHGLALNEVLHGAVGKVLDVLMHRISFPTIQRLKLGVFTDRTSPHLHSKLIQFLQAIPSLKELEESALIQKDNIAELETTVSGKLVVLPKLQKLHILTTQILYCMEVPRLEELVFLFSPITFNSQLRLPSQFGDCLRRLTANDILIRALDQVFGVEQNNESYPWPAITHLSVTISYCSSFNVGHRFENLTWISFRGDHWMRGGIRATDAFLLGLLKGPSVCPTLCTIVSEEYPIWDLLFTVMVKRLTTPNTTKISCLEVPGFPVLSIIKSITELMSDTAITSGVQAIDTYSMISKRIRDRVGKDDLHW